MVAQPPRLRAAAATVEANIAALMVCIVFPFIWPSDTEAKGAHTKWRKWGVPASPPRRDCGRPPGAPPVGSLTVRRKRYRIRSKHRHCCSAKRVGQRIGAWRQSLTRQAVRMPGGPVRGSAQTRQGRKISPARMAHDASPVRQWLGTKGGFVADSRCLGADQNKAGPAALLPGRCNSDPPSARKESDSRFQLRRRSRPQPMLHSL